MSENTDDMGKEDRKRQILSLLDETDLALPPKVLHRNLRDRGATFSLNTVQRHLQEMLDDGYVEKSLSESYYQITQEGRALLRGDLDDPDADLSG